MRLQLDFAAQVLGHLFESLDQIIADMRALSTLTRSPGADPRPFFSFFSTRWLVWGGMPVLSSVTPLLVVRFFNAL